MMKNYDEMAADVLIRIRENREARRKKRRTVICTAVPLCCLCAAVVVFVGIRGAEDKVPVSVLPGIEQTANTEASAQTTGTGSGGEPTGARIEKEQDVTTGTAEPAGARTENAQDVTTGTAQPDYTAVPTEEYTGKEMYTEIEAARPAVTEVDNGVCLFVGNEPETYNIKTLISSFGGAELSGDISVNNGAVFLSDALGNAIREYGDSVVYCVSLVLFSNGTELDSTSAEAAAEMERLAGYGYPASFETYNDGYTLHNCLTFPVVSPEQLTDFPAAEDIGYLLCLYDELGY